MSETEPLGLHSAYIKLLYITWESISVYANYTIGPKYNSILQKRLKLGLCNFHHRLTPWLSFLTVNFAAKFQREHREWGAEWETGMKNTQVSANKSPCLDQKRCKTGPRLLWRTNRKSDMLSIGTKVDFLGWPWTAISSNFLGILLYFAFLGSKLRQQQLNEWR